MREGLLRTAETLLAERVARPLTFPHQAGLQPKALFLGDGQNALEVVVIETAAKIPAGALQAAWKARRGGRAAPVLLVALNGSQECCAVPRAKRRRFASGWVAGRPSACAVPPWINLTDTPPSDIDAARINRALDIVEASWPRREEMMLREWFEDEAQAGAAKSAFLIERILDTGMEPFRGPEPLPPIRFDEIELVCWLAVSPTRME